MSEPWRLEDRFHRFITYLRISVTDRCNLRCRYCMPAEGVAWKPREQILTFEEIRRIVEVAVRLGVRKVRLTGGEPLVRREVTRLVEMLAQVPGLEEIALSTNGVLLAEKATELKAAGLSRVNVSLDTLHPEKFRLITRGGELERVLRGIEVAHTVGLRPVKVNTVVMRGFNDDEVVDFALWTLESPIVVRFIELMPFLTEEGMDLTNPFKPIDCEAKVAEFLPLEEVRRRIEGALGPLEPAPPPPSGGSLPLLPSTSGPAEYWRLPNAQGLIGFIHTMSDHICQRCNRVRLTADGKLKPCLLSEEEVEVLTAARYGTEEDIERAFRQLMAIKPEKGTRSRRRPEAMVQIGG